MANVKLKNKRGDDVVYSNVNVLKIPSANEDEGILEFFCPDGTFSIAENKVFDVSEYKYVSVNVTGSGGAQINGDEASAEASSVINVGDFLTQGSLTSGKFDHNGHGRSPIVAAIDSNRILCLTYNSYNNLCGTVFTQTGGKFISSTTQTISTDLRSPDWAIRPKLIKIGDGKFAYFHNNSANMGSMDLYQQIGYITVTSSNDISMTLPSVELDIPKGYGDQYIIPVPQQSSKFFISYIDSSMYLRCAVMSCPADGNFSILQNVATDRAYDGLTCPIYPPITTDGGHVYVPFHREYNSETGYSNEYISVCCWFSGGGDTFSYEVGEMGGSGFTEGGMGGIDLYGVLDTIAARTSGDAYRDSNLTLTFEDLYIDDPERGAGYVTGLVLGVEFTSAHYYPPFLGYGESKSFHLNTNLYREGSSNFQGEYHMYGDPRIYVDPNDNSKAKVFALMSTTDYFTPGVAGELMLHIYTIDLSNTDDDSNGNTSDVTLEEIPLDISVSSTSYHDIFPSTTFAPTCIVDMAGSPIYSFLISPSTSDNEYDSDDRDRQVYVLKVSGKSVTVAKPGDAILGVAKTGGAVGDTITYYVPKAED